MLEAAEEAFVELGYDGVTLNEIVSRAGYTTGAIYNHFDAKADILMEVVRRVLSRVFQVVFEAAGNGSLDAQSRALVDTWFSLPRADRITLAEVHLAALRHERVRMLLDAAIAEAVEVSIKSINTAQAAGQANPDLDPTRIAKIIMVFCSGLNHLDTIDPALSRDPVTRGYLGEWLTRLYDPLPPGRETRTRILRRRRGTRIRAS